MDKTIMYKQVYLLLSITLLILVLFPPTYAEITNHSIRTSLYPNICPIPQRLESTSGTKVVSPNSNMAIFSCQSKMLSSGGAILQLAGDNSIYTFTANADDVVTIAVYSQPLDQIGCDPASLPPNCIALTNVGSLSFETHANRQYFIYVVPLRESVISWTSNVSSNIEQPEDCSDARELTLPNPSGLPFTLHDQIPVPGVLITSCADKTVRLTAKRYIFNGNGHGVRFVVCSPRTVRLLIYRLNNQQTCNSTCLLESTPSDPLPYAISFSDSYDPCKPSDYAATVSIFASASETYLLAVSTSPETHYRLSVMSVPVTNTDWSCENSEPLGLLPRVVTSSTIFMDIDGRLKCHAQVPRPAQWYVMEGVDKGVVFNPCGMDRTMRAQLHVFEALPRSSNNASCAAAECLQTITCPSLETRSANPHAEELRIFMRRGRTYHIQVVSALTWMTGSFTLSVTAVEDASTSNDSNSRLEWLRSTLDQSATVQLVQNNYSLIDNIYAGFVDNFVNGSQQTFMSFAIPTSSTVTRQRRRVVFAYVEISAITRIMNETDQVNPALVDIRRVVHSDWNNFNPTSRPFLAGTLLDTMQILPPDQVSTAFAKRYQFDVTDALNEAAPGTSNIDFALTHTGIGPGVVLATGRKTSQSQLSFIPTLTVLYHSLEPNGEVAAELVSSQPVYTTDPPETQRRILTHRFTFSLPTLPTTGTIHSAFLKFFGAIGNSSDGGAFVSLYYVDSTQSGNLTIMPISRSVSSSFALETPGATLVSNVAMTPPPGRYYIIGVTQFVKQQLSSRNSTMVFELRFTRPIADASIEVTTTLSPEHLPQLKIYF